MKAKESAAERARRLREADHWARIDAQRQALDELGVSSTRVLIEGREVLAIEADHMDKLLALLHMED